jgi:hypothetical protein
MNPKQPGGGSANPPREPISDSEIKISRNAIEAGEKVLGRSLRSTVPVLSPEERAHD